MTEDLTPDQREALTILQEEAAEVIHAVSKILRHGPKSEHPDTGVDNDVAAMREISQFIVVLTVASAAGLFTSLAGGEQSRFDMIEKIESLRRYSSIDPDILDKIEL